MPPTALAVPLPLSPSTVPDHPALKFYTLYGQKFPKTAEQWATQPSDDLYSSDCKTILPNNTVINGGQASWEFFRRFYARFEKVEREVLSLVDVSDDEGKHSIHAEFMTKMFVRGGGQDSGNGEAKVVHLPQSFVYTLGKADEGKGTLGLQIRELRNYYDMKTLERAMGEAI